MSIDLSPGQALALDAILKARSPGDRHLLTGYAGSGKTTLMQELARRLRSSGRSVILTAPTHKAVSVLSRKVSQAGIDVPCRTIHSLLELKAEPYGDRLIFKRSKRASPVTDDVVVVDECSMVSKDLYDHIKRHLPMAFVLFVGDPAQLPPVGEVESRTFQTRASNHLDTIIRQAAGNPILDAAQAIRLSQGGAVDWSWMKPARAGDTGVCVPSSGQVDDWMKKAFTSAKFEENPDSFRYLSWTNARVAEVNNRIRQWRYGDNIPTPFMPGEMALFRGPVIIDGDMVFNTNEEARVLDIERSTFMHQFEDEMDLDGWTAEIPSWKITMQKDDGAKVTVHMPSDDREYNKIINRIKDEAAENKVRWKHLHEFQASLAKLQSIYALTVHNSQGSTFDYAFVDIPDIRKRQSDNLLEMQQLLYVAATRPSQALVLVGAQ